MVSDQCRGRGTERYFAACGDAPVGGRQVSAIASAELYRRQRGCVIDEDALLAALIKNPGRQLAQLWNLWNPF